MKERSSRNKTITLSPDEREQYKKRLLRLTSVRAEKNYIVDRIICQDMLEALLHFPLKFVDVLFLDPPYNLTKKFNTKTFKKIDLNEYAEMFEKWISALLKTLKPTASIYVCSDWRMPIFPVLQKYFKVRNRITWEREKGRGALYNWKNCSEDIWFCTMSDQYSFDADAVKLKRKVIAPYKVDGKPKDWEETEQGNFRLTYPSNLWTDITVPFWSMSENTDHPTQKPEKLLAKIILASSKPEDVILDPFLGVGTAAVVAKKLNRHFVGIEMDELFCCLAEKRLALAEEDPSIQGYSNGVFWERNVPSSQRK